MIEHNSDHVTISRKWILKRIDECKLMEYTSFSQTSKAVLEEVLKQEIKPIVMSVPISKKVKSLMDQENMIERVFKIVESNFNVTKKEFLEDRRRNPEIVLPRQIACWLMRNTTNLSLTQVGNILHYDHCSVIYACKKIDGYVKVNKNGDGKLPFEMLAELTKCL